MPRALVLSIAAFLALAAPTRAAISITGVADKTKYAATVSFTVTPDPNAATTTALLDGLATTVGSQVTVTVPTYHELKAESRTAGGALVDSKTIRFIVTAAGRNGTEDGIPPHTPLRTVNDAPSAFAGQTLKIIAPATWPAGLPIPIAAKLVNASDETIRLNGPVTFAAFPLTTLQLRRGWGSVIAPAVSTAGTLNLGAGVNGLTPSRTITVEAAPAFDAILGSIVADDVFPPNSHIYISDTVTIAAGVTVTIGAGSIVKVYSGNGTAGSAAEIVVNGKLQIDGTESNPVVFTPDAVGKFWGGIELPAATSNVTATHTIFTGSGEDQTWFNTHGGYSTHKNEQALFLVSGSGTGTSIGAQIHLTSCYAFSLRGQQMNSKTNTWIDLSRTLMQRCITCGELNGSKVTIDRSALIEFPSETDSFVDGDNDGIYLTNGDLSLTNSVIGFTKDDGIDSGGDGGNNPFTPTTDVTPFTSLNNWIEGTFHEGNSLSGTRNVTHTGCVFLNCGQGVEAGYSAGSTADGPNVVIDGCLFAGNMVGVRWGDNYGSGYNYNASAEVKNTFLLNNLYRDAFSGNWHPTNANGWIYQDATANNSFGHPYFNVHDNYLTQPDPAHHPTNTEWNGPAFGNLIAPFMPVPGSKVGVAICSYAPAQSDTSAYPGSFVVRLSTFSSQTVTVDCTITTRLPAPNDAESIVANGTLIFEPGETAQTVSTTIPNPGNYALIHVALTNPVNAEVTGEAWYFKSPSLTNTTLIAKGSTGWRYRETRNDPGSAWKQLAFDDTGAEWAPATLPAGFALTTQFNPAVTFGTAPGYGGDVNNKTKAYYFRKVFNVSDPTQIASLTFNVRRDDGIVAWLNNDASPTVLSADAAWNAPYNYDNLAPNATAANTNVYLPFTIPASKLVPGQNILAIELHQSSITSSDLLLDCELVATPASPFALRLTRVGPQSVLYWFDPAATLEQSIDLTNWFAVPGSLSPQPFTPTTSKGFFRLRR